MPLTLHEAFVPSAQQILTGMRALIDTAQTHCAENSLEDADLIEAKLAPDMWPLPWHVRAGWVHTKLALDLAPTGEFSPDFTDIPDSWDAMRAMADEALAALEAAEVDALEALADDTVHFVLGGTRRMSFTISNFLLSFSQPNFYFHAATFYDILRMKGLPLGKRDYLHMPRILAS
ncbi:MAG: DUF1993 domain-containing protein [Pseudomonadota bacterium]